MTIIFESGMEDEEDTFDVEFTGKFNTSGDAATVDQSDPHHGDDGRRVVLVCRYADGTHADAQIGDGRRDVA